MTEPIAGREWIALSRPVAPQSKTTWGCWISA